MDEYPLPTDGEDRYTIATLYRGDLCETYVAVFPGDLTEQEEKAIAADMGLRMEDGDPLDWLGFAGVSLADKTAPSFLFVNCSQGDLRLHTGEERRIEPGRVFDTPFESSCIATQEPDSDGNFMAFDSDSVLCQFSLPMVTYIGEIVAIPKEDV